MKSDIKYSTKIQRALSRFGTNSTENPDTRSNIGNLLGSVFLWAEVQRYAAAQVKGAWKALEDSGLTPDNASLSPGEHAIANSPHFVLTYRISEPVRRFDPDALAQSLLKSKYKVPLHTTKELIEASKLPSKSTVTKKIIEKD